MMIYVLFQHDHSTAIMCKGTKYCHGCRYVESRI